MNSEIAFCEFLAEKTDNKEMQWKKIGESVYSGSYGRFDYQLSVGGESVLSSCMNAISDGFEVVTNDENVIKSILYRSVRQSAYFSDIVNDLKELVSKNEISWYKIRSKTWNTTWYGETDELSIRVSFNHDRDDNEWYDIYVNHRTDDIFWKKEYTPMEVYMYGENHIVNKLIENYERAVG